MKEDNLKLVQQDIDEALGAIEEMEQNLKSPQLPKASVKEKFIFLSQKLSELEEILKLEGIL